MPRSARVKAWIDYLQKCKPSRCTLCSGVIGPAATFENCCLCSRPEVLRHAVAIAPAPIVATTFSGELDLFGEVAACANHKSEAA